VVVSVRPESVRLLAATGPAPSGNVFDVRVLARTFQGETEQVRVRLGDREVVISDRPTALPPAGPGEAARVHLPPDAVRVYARAVEHAQTATVIAI
jgi:hypothetical protein